MFGGLRDVVEAKGKYFLVDSRYTFDCGLETMVFPCNQHGEVTCWSEIYSKWHRDYAEMSLWHHQLCKSLKDVLEQESPSPANFPEEKCGEKQCPVTDTKFYVPLDVEAMDTLNKEAIKCGVVIPYNAHMEVSVQGWYIVFWEVGNMQFEYNPSRGAFRFRKNSDTEWSKWSK